MVLFSDLHDDYLELSTVKDGNVLFGIMIKIGFYGDLESIYMSITDLNFFLGHNEKTFLPLKVSQRALSTGYGPIDANNGV